MMSRGISKASSPNFSIIGRMDIPSDQLLELRLLHHYITVTDHTSNSHNNLLIFLTGAESLKGVSGARMICLPFCLRSQESSEAPSSFILSRNLQC